MKKSYQIVYLSYDGLSDPLGQSQIIPYVLGLSKLGNFHFTIISFEKEDAYKDRKIQIQENLLKANIKWVPNMYTKNPPILATIYDLWRLEQSIKNVLKERKIDIIHARGYISSIVALRFKKKFKIPFIFDMRGWWPDEKLESGNWDNIIFKPLYKFFKKAEVKFFKKADKIVSLTNIGKIEILNNKYANSKKIGVIPTCVDFIHFPKFSFEIRNETRKQLNINSQSTVLIYSGSLGGNYDFNDFVLIFKLFLDLNPNNIVLIVSKTIKSYISQQLDKNSLDKSKIRIINSDFNQVYKYLQASDIGLILYQKSFSSIGRSPTKLGEYWASGLPIVSLKGIGDLESIIEKYPFGGKLLNEIKRENLKDIFNDLSYKVDKRKLRIAAKEYFNIDDGVKFYSNIYEEIIN